jgi:hypothetical protein
MDNDDVDCNKSFLSGSSHEDKTEGTRLCYKKKI